MSGGFPKSKKEYPFDWEWESGDLVLYKNLGTEYTARLVEHRWGDCWAAEVVTVVSAANDWKLTVGDVATVVKGGAVKVGVGPEPLRRHPDLANLESFLDEFYTLEAAS